MLKTRNDFEVQVGMIVYDFDGVYEIKEIDETRRMCRVQEIYFDSKGAFPVGQSWWRTFGEISKCDK